MRKSILLVEEVKPDLPRLSELFSKSDRTESYSIHSICSEEAKRYIHSFNYDLLVLDFHAAFLSDSKLAEEHKLSNGSIPFIIVNRGSDAGAKSRAFEAGASYYIDRNDLTGDFLDKAISDCLKGSEPSNFSASSDSLHKVLQFILEIVAVDSNMEDLPGYIAAKTARFLDCDGVSVAKREEDGEFVYTGSYGELVFPSNFGISEEHPLLKSAASEKGIIFHGENEFVEELSGNPLSDRVGSGLLIPLFFGKIMVGVVSVFSRRRNAFPPELENPLELIGAALGPLFYRKNAEQESSANRNMLNHALKIAHLGNWQSDIRTNRVKWSEEVYSIFGISKEMFGGNREDFFELVHPEDRARVREFVVQIFEEDAIQEIEYRIIRSDGEIRFVAVRADLIRNSKGEATQFFGTIQDVTEKKLTEERLGQSQKMEAVGQLAGGLAHDFNNLLNVILANLDLLEIKLKDSPELLKRVNSGQDAVQRGVELNRRLLSFSRKQPINPEVFDVNKLLFDFVPILERLETEKVGLEFEISQEFLPCEIEKNGMENALLNLAINARDAMPEGGTIRISSGLLKNASTEGVRISGLNSADYCLVTVTDTGIGMAEEIKAHIFEPFFSTKGSGKGSGLGLSMVYGFVKQSKGFIKVISVPGHGTSFLLFLPIYNSYPETPQNPGAILP